MSNADTKVSKRESKWRRYGYSVGTRKTGETQKSMYTNKIHRETKYN
jgi:hypothetical protein